eukprot:m.129143 g.129143  ORF g.129143 m.129143 type:complete len:795 (+) comp13886_c0_seq1:188-2572(+)
MRVPTPTQLFSRTLGWWKTTTKGATAIDRSCNYGSLRQTAHSLGATWAAPRLSTIVASSLPKTLRHSSLGRVNALVSNGRRLQRYPSLSLTMLQQWCSPSMGAVAPIVGRALHASAPFAHLIRQLGSPHHQPVAVALAVARQHKYLRTLNKPMQNNVLLWIATAIVLYALTGTEANDHRVISWQEFYSLILSKGEVDRLVVDEANNSVTVHVPKDAVIEGYNDKHPTRSLPPFVVKIGSVKAFERAMEQASVDLGVNLQQDIAIKYSNSGDGEMGSTVLTMTLMVVLFMAGMMMVSRFMGPGGAAGKGRGGGSGGSQMNPFNQNNKTFTAIENPSVKFSDVAGLSEAKVELKEFVDYLVNPKRYMQLGASVPKGALLVGPPGTGKTLLAKAVAGEAKVRFYSVSGSDFVEMFVGVGPARVRSLFETARTNSPSIVYIDEIDAVAKARSSGNSIGANSERESTLNQLLVEMDGVADSAGVLVLASTNRAELLDKALLRPGRFDRHISCDIPTLQERKEIFKIHMKGLKLQRIDDDIVERVASLTPGLSGAQIASICNEAALHAARMAQPAITMDDLEYAVDRVVGGMERRSKVVSSAERRVVAHHEIGHALVAWLQHTTDPVLKVSIVPRGSGALGFTQSLPSDSHLYTTEQLIEKMAVLLGGRAAEQVMFNRVTTGAHDDLQRVTEIAYNMVTKFGMVSEVGLLVHDIPKSDEGKKKMSQTMMRKIDAEARKIVDQAYKRALDIVSAHRKELETLSAQLLESEMLTQKQIEEVLGPKQLPPSAQSEAAQALENE